MAGTSVWLTGFAFLHAVTTSAWAAPPVGGTSSEATPPAPPTTPGTQQLPQTNVSEESQKSPNIGTPGPLPKAPSAPAPLSKKAPAEMQRCQRQYLYRGKLLDCDSQLQEDGEKLRPVLSQVPAAVLELNEYQRGRRHLEFAAYTGSLGLVVAVAGWLVSRQYQDPSGAPSSTGRKIRNVAALGGLSLTAGSLIYGVSFLKANERHLGRAVQFYNEARPQDRIELQFTTGISF